MISREKAMVTSPVVAASMSSGSREVMAAARGKVKRRENAWEVGNKVAL